MRFNAREETQFGGLLLHFDLAQPRLLSLVQNVPLSHTAKRSQPGVLGRTPAAKT